jgi:adenylosuccinate lyase
MAELPFMATEEVLMAAVQRGGDRQELHERIRRHSLDAAAQVKQQGRPNDLIERLKRDVAFAGIDLTSVMDPNRFVGRAPQQVEVFVGEVVEPIRSHYKGELGQDVQLKD